MQQRGSKLTSAGLLSSLLQSLLAFDEVLKQVSGSGSVDSLTVRYQAHNTFH